MNPLPVSIVTGFLGSGKTTLLSNLLAGTASRRLAILVNEFGEVSIDGALLRAADSRHVEIHDLSNGLVAYGDDDQFLPAMRAIAERRNHVDHVLIETSGLALPTAVMEALQQPPLVADFTLDATLAVVDTPLLIAGKFGREHGLGEPVAALFDQQMEFADIVVLNKIDDLDDAALLDAEARVRAIAPQVRFIELAFRAKLDPRLTLGLRLHEARPGRSNGGGGAIRYMPAAGALPPADQARFDGHSHAGVAPHLHGIATHKHFHEHDPGWQSFVLRSTVPQPAAALRAALVEAARAEPILRVKGFAAVVGDTRRLMLQGVRSRIDAQWASEATGSARCELVFIGYHPNRARVVELLAARTGTCWR